tara:strand:- start:722 stop:1855 length:1134 start_codon:yes stop_codon:yes gene_type:complete
MIPYSRQKIYKEDIKSVLQVLKSDFLTTGPKVKKFEEDLCNFFGSKFSISTNSATSALHLGCLALGLKKNDYLWTSSISFVASANCGLYCQANVDFLDINPKTLNVCLDKLEIKLLEAKKQGKLPKIIIPVHLGGNPCDMVQLKKLSNVYKFKILEDASHAVGSKYQGSYIGSCKFSNACVFSFHPVKSMTTGEGGAVLTNDKKMIKKLISLRAHGIVRENINKKFKWHYEQKYLGYNYRMSDLQAALGISQLKKLNFFTKKRNLLAKIYKKKLNPEKIIIQKVEKESYSSYHLFIIRTTKSKKKKIYDALLKNKIITSFHYMPIYKHPYYKKYNYNLKNFKESERYYNDGMSIPLYIDLNNNIINKICKIINKIVD